MQTKQIPKYNWNWTAELILNFNIEREKNIFHKIFGKAQTSMVFSRESKKKSVPDFKAESKLGMLGSPKLGNIVSTKVGSAEAGILVSSGETRPFT